MATPADAALVFLLLVTPVALYILWSDVARMRIPNRAVYLLAALFLVSAPLLLPLAEVAARGIGAALVLAVAFLLWQIGRMGAGDAKYLAAMAPFVARGDALVFLQILAAALLLALLLHRGARAVPALRALAPGWKSWTSPRFPAGTALSGALLAYLALAAASGR